MDSRLQIKPKNLLPKILICAMVSTKNIDCLLDKITPLLKIVLWDFVSIQFKFLRKYCRKKLWESILRFLPKSWPCPGTVTPGTKTYHTHWQHFIMEGAAKASWQPLELGQIHRERIRTALFGGTINQPMKYPGLLITVHQILVNCLWKWTK